MLIMKEDFHRVSHGGGVGGGLTLDCFFVDFRSMRSSITNFLLDIEGNHLPFATDEPCVREISDYILLEL